MSVIQKQAFDLDGIKTVRYIMIAQDAAQLEFLKGYSRFGDEDQFKIGTTVEVRPEHVDWIEAQFPNG